VAEGKGHAPGSGVVALSLPTSNKMQSSGGHKRTRVIVDLWTCVVSLEEREPLGLSCGHGFYPTNPQVHRPQSRRAI
jgi:hypothetical protein